MDKDTLKKANELEKLIEQTEGSLESLKKMKEGRGGRRDNKSYEDGVYRLCISEYGDGSGHKADLTRYFGNEKLLNIIIKEVSDQLGSFKSDFEKL